MKAAEKAKLKKEKSTNLMNFLMTGSDLVEEFCALSEDEAQ